MAHRRPRGIRELGDAQRATTIAGYFILELWDDPRVRTEYERWHATRDDAFKAIARRTVVYRLTEAQQNLEFDRHIDRERETMRAFVRDVLGLGRWAWIAIALLRFFTDHDWNVRHPDSPPRKFAVRVAMTRRNRQGTRPTDSRRPRHDGLDLARAASWYYQRHVQQPSADIPDLAAAYVERLRASGTHRQPDGAHKVIQDGLDTVAWHLDLVQARSIEEPLVHTSPATLDRSIH
jgi:hypothetical protein